MKFNSNHQTLVDMAAWAGVISARASETGVPPIDPAHRINLTWRIHRIYVWIHRHFEVYGRAPSTTDIEDGMGMDEAAASRDLGELVDIGSVVRTADGWRPVRAP